MILLRLSIAKGISRQVVSQAGTVPGSAADTVPATASNRASTVNVVVFVNAARAYTVPTTLRSTTNLQERLLVRVRAKGNNWLLTVKPREGVRRSIRSRTRRLAYHQCSIRSEQPA